MTTASNSARTHRRLRDFARGDKVVVQFGLNRHPGTVADIRNGRVFVDIVFDGSEERFTASYQPADVEPA